jgi:hypothetical protein
VNIVSERVRPSPIILHAVRDELPSSRIGRHADLYRVSIGHMLPHCRSVIRDDTLRQVARRRMARDLI